MACKYYQQVKAAGGAAYEALKAQKRQEKAVSRLVHGRQPYDKGGRSRTIRGRQGLLVMRARTRARASGLEHTITWADIYWPTHCPVLGMELNYMGYQLQPSRERGVQAAPNSASLDRWDNSKGYVPGNVYVVSLRANGLKSDATPAEMAAVYAYMTYDPLGDVRW